MYVLVRVVVLVVWSDCHPGPAAGATSGPADMLGAPGNDCREDVRRHSEEVARNCSEKGYYTILYCLRLSLRGILNSSAVTTVIVDVFCRSQVESKANHVSKSSNKSTRMLEQ